MSNNKYKKQKAEGGELPKILKKQRKTNAFTMLLFVLSLTAIVLLFILLPEFNYYFYVLVGFVGLAILTYAFQIFYFGYRIQKTKGKTEMTSAEIVGNDINEAYNFGQIGLVVCDKDHFVMWANDFLSKRMPNIIDKNILLLYPSLSTLLENKENSDKTEEKTVICVNNNFVYEVVLLKEARLFVFKDITQFNKADNENKNNAPVIGYICIDNYSDVQINTSDESHFNDMLTGVRSLLADFARSSSSLMRKLSEDRYFFITTVDKYNAIFDDNFSVVDKVRNLYQNGFTISIGVSLYFPEYSRLAEIASNALDVALSRGGDQTVIAPFGKSMIFIGGKSELKPNQNRVKMRTLSNSFLTTLKNYKTVLIMGHGTGTPCDFDSMGSALGVYLLANYCKVKAKICFEDQLVEEKCRMGVQSQFSKDEMEEIFVDLKDVDQYVADTTLLVLVDHNNPNMSIFHETVKKLNHIAVIDHHRPGQVGVTNPGPVFNCIDSSASSASELITSFIMYSTYDIPVDPRTATFLLTGISLDTHFFKEKATSATFEAASQLVKYHADSAMVDDFLKENLEEYKQKIAIMNAAETPEYGCLVATSPDADIVPPILLSIVANDALQISGINCSFCIGRCGEHEVKISARSDGSVNCQMLMEKLGGGGHLAMAATVFDTGSVDDAKKKLLLILNDYLEDAKTVRSVKE